MMKDRVDRVMKYYGDIVGTRQNAERIINPIRKADIKRECDALLVELGYKDCRLMRGDKFV